MYFFLTIFSLINIKNFLINFFFSYIIISEIFKKNLIFLLYSNYIIAISKFFIIKFLLYLSFELN